MSDVRRVTFIAEGSAAELQQAAAKAAEALRALADQAAKQASAAATAGKKTIESNEAVARSFVDAAEAARASAATSSAASRKSADAAKVSASEQAAASTKTQASAKKTAVVAEESAAQQATAAKTTQTALGRTATAAEESAATQRRAAANAARAVKTSAAETIAAAGKTEAAFGRSGAVLTRWGRNAALAIAGVTAATTYLGIHFESETMKLHTQAGVSLRELGKLRDGVLAMAPDVGAMPDRLTEGLYHVVSSMDAVLPKATKVREELAILREAAKGAAIGGSDLGQTAYVLSSAMNALGQRGDQARSTMAQLNAIVGTGDMRMQDMVGAMSTGLIPAAENFGISLHSVGAALAYMVDRGTPAQLAATRLRMSFSLLGAPTKQSARLLSALGMSSDDVRARTEAMTKALEKAGLRTTTLAADLRKPNGIGVALNDLNRHLIDSGLNANASAALISRAFGGGRSGTAIMELVQHTDTLSKKYEQQGRVVRTWGAAWRGTQQTVQQQLKEMEAGVIALGTRLGEWLLPRVNDLIQALRDTVRWFDHNRVAARALGELFAGFLAVAITSWAISLARKLATAGREVAALGRGIAGLPGRLQRSIAGTSAVAAGEAKAAGGASSIFEAERGMLGGMRSGYGLPGSAVNPLVVTMVGGGIGAGGRPAGTTAETVAAEERAVARTEAAAATQAGAAATLRSSVGALVGKLAKGGMIAGGGLLASEMVGTAIGGETGHKVSSIGSSAAIGAGLGSFIGPEGTAAGAIVGGLVGLLRNVGKDYSEKVAEQATKGLAPEIRAAFHRRLQDDARAVDKTAPAGDWYYDGKTGRWRQRPATGAAARAQSRLGTDTAAAMERGFGKFRFLNVNSMLSDFSERMRQFPVVAREAAAQSMIAFARRMEQDGRLPRGATTQLIADLEAQYPPLRAFLAQQGADSIRALALSIRNGKVEDEARAQVARAGATFQQLGDILRQTGGDTRFQWGLAMDFLVTQTRHGTAQARRAAAAELAAMVGLSRRDAGAFAQWMAVGTSRAAISAATNLSSLTQVFAIALGDITGQTQTLSRAFGIRAVDYVAQHPKKVIATGLQAAVGIAGAIGLAGGGYVGTRGERGRDTVHAILGRGEAVVNGPQQGPVEIGLAVSHALGAQPYDSLSALFRGERRKHYMASGGFAGGQVFTASIFGGHNDPSAFNRSTASGKVANDSLWGFAELSNPPGSLNFSALGHLPMGTVLGFTNPATHRTVHAPKVDVGAGGAGLDGRVRGVDLTYAVGQALGVHGLANLIVTGLHGALAQAGSALPRVLAPKITGPGGPLQRAANAALRRTARDASDHLAKEMTKLGATGSAFPAFSGPTPAGVGSFDGLPVAKWIIPELAYGRAHGWPGHITSGYRPGHDSHTASGDSEHRGTVYPHGAVDFGGMVDPVGLANKLAFMRATAGYSGPRLLPAQGFRDDGHMSGTGHAQGGWVGLARGLAGKHPAGAAARAAGRSARETRSRINRHTSKHHRKAPKGDRRPKDPIDRALAPFRLIPDVNDLPGNVAAITGHLDALGNQQQLLDTIAGFDTNRYVLAADMPYLQPTLQKGQDIHAGMTLKAALRSYNRLANSTTDNALLDLQGQLLDWAMQEPDHQLLSPDDVAEITSTFAPTGVALEAFQSMPSAQLANLGAQIGEMGHQVRVERGAIKKIARAIREREERRRLVDQLAHSAKRRLDNINRDLQRLTTRSLRDRVAAAQDRGARSQRIYDAETQRGYLSDLIAHERSTANPDEGAIAGWEQRKRELEHFAHEQRTPSNATGSALVALAKNQLTNAKHPIEEDLRKLTGASTHIGTSGMLGKIRREIRTLRAGANTMQGDIDGIVQSALPSARLTRQQLLQSLPEQDRPVLAAETGGSDDSELLALQRQQNEQLAQAYAVSQAQFAIFKNFTSLLPAYEHGGLVRNTGLALVHEGEWITPNPRGPYGSQIPAAASTTAGHTTVHLHLGTAEGLVKLIDARVDSRAPHTVSVVQGQRSRALGQAPGGRSRRAY